MTRSSYHHGDLRSALLEAAVAVIRERNVHALSMRECARRAGVSTAAPYRHFKNKQALLAALAGQGFGWLAEAGLAAMRDEDEPRARLDAYGVAYVQFAIDHPEHHQLMFASEWDHFAAELPDQERSAAAFNLLQDTAAEIIGNEEQAEAAAFAFWSLVHGISMLILDGRVPPELYDTPEKLEQLTRGCFAMWRSF